MRIERTANGSQSGIWALAWNPHPEDGHDLLCVADWAQTISFYSLSGKQVRLFFIMFNSSDGFTNSVTTGKQVRFKD